MEYISVQEAAKSWGISTRRVQVLCETNRIEGVLRIGNVYAIPKDAEKPKDLRVKSGNYVKK